MFLRSAASTLWLPFLPSALPRAAWAAPPPADPRRLLYFHSPNGMLVEDATPAASGPDYDMPLMASLVEPVRHRINIVSGISNVAASMGAAVGTHEGCMVAMLSDHTLERESGGVADTSSDGAAITVDQYAANCLGLAGGPTAPFPSMQLGTPAQCANCTPYFVTLSWAAGSIPLAPLTDAKTVFDRMFAGYDPTLTEADVARRTALRKSLLDGVSERATDLTTKLNWEDRTKLDQYMTGVRDLEMRIDRLAAIQCGTPDEPPTNVGFVESVDLMIQLMLTAFTCDYTRIVTFMLAPSGSSIVYDFLDGVYADHHTLSHYGAMSAQQPDSPIPDAHDQLMTVKGWEFGKFAELVAAMELVSENEGDLLSNSMVTLVTEFGESNEHTSTPCTYYVAGGESGGVVPGHHRVYAPGTPHSNLWRRQLDFLGVPSEHFGTFANGSLDLTTPS
jgi:hypothetical protein